MQKRKIRRKESSGVRLGAAAKTSVWAEIGKKVTKLSNFNPRNRTFSYFSTKIIIAVVFGRFGEFFIHYSHSRGFHFSLSCWHPFKCTHQAGCSLFHTQKVKAPYGLRRQVEAKIQPINCHYKFVKMYPLERWGRRWFRGGPCPSHAV